MPCTSPHLHLNLGWNNICHQSPITQPKTSGWPPFRHDLWIYDRWIYPPGGAEPLERSSTQRVRGKFYMRTDRVITEGPQAVSLLPHVNFSLTSTINFPHCHFSLMSTFPSCQLFPHVNFSLMSTFPHVNFITHKPSHHLSDSQSSHVLTKPFALLHSPPPDTRHLEHCCSHTKSRPTTHLS